jgi:glycosyltransferase involved in cell wall biosynthesis
MRIAQIAPLFESVPPKMYGGTERVVHGLTEELVKRGHEVTLFASGDSTTSAKLVPCCERGLRLEQSVADFHAYTVIQLGMVYTRANEFDIIHNHVDYFAFPFTRLTPVPTVTTLHGRLDIREVRQVYPYFPDLPVVSISNAQRVHLPNAHWVGTVYNGIDVESFTLRRKPGSYLAFLGRIAHEKRPDRAIEIARAVGMPIKIAAKIDPSDRLYFEQAITPLLRHPLVDYVGEIDEDAKDEFLGNAYALLFPIDWPEPFGITLIEAMATGTPVIASACGSVPEVLEDNVTGFVCQNLREMIDAVDRITQLSREACRQRVIDHFTAAQMAEKYEVIYQKLLRQHPVSVAV